MRGPTVCHIGGAMGNKVRALECDGIKQGSLQMLQLLLGWSFLCLSLSRSNWSSPLGETEKQALYLRQAWASKRHSQYGTASVAQLLWLHGMWLAAEMWNSGGKILEADDTFARVNELFSPAGTMALNNSFLSTPHFLIKHHTKRERHRLTDTKLYSGKLHSIDVIKAESFL